MENSLTISGDASSLTGTTAPVAGGELVILSSNFDASCCGGGEARRESTLTISEWKWMGSRYMRRVLKMRELQREAKESWQMRDGLAMRMRPA